MLQSPFQVPIDFSHETACWESVSNLIYGLWPERMWLAAPRPLEDFGEQQHRHVAADTVAHSGDVQQFFGHRFLRGGIAVVELECIWPPRKIRIAAVSENEIAARDVYS